MFQVRPVLPIRGAAARRSMIARAAAALACTCLWIHAAAGAPRWEEQESGTVERLRGVSAVSADIAWASGNRGTVLRTIDGGRNWQLLKVPGADELDFRDVEAFDADTAYALSAGQGTAARIYKTVNGGKHWTLQFTNTEPAGFYNAIAFWNAERGLAFGDPVAGRNTVIRTEDGGNTWQTVPPENLPPALPNEAAFAASGGCLTTQGTSLAWFGTGGAERARIFHTRDGGYTWQVADTPLIAGRNSAGVFAIAFRDDSRGLAVGGDYRRIEERNLNLAHTDDGGASWQTPGRTLLPGFRSAVAFLPGGNGARVIAVGPAGSDLSVNGGRTWRALGGRELHAVSVAGTAQRPAIWAVGETGRIVRLQGL